MAAISDLQVSRAASFEKAAKRREAFGPISMEIRGQRRERHASTVSKNGMVRSGRVLKVRTPVSSVPFLRFFRFFRTAEVWAVGWGAWCVGTCEECDTKNRLPARYSSETDVLFPARLRNREPIESAPDSYQPFIAVCNSVESARSFFAEVKRNPRGIIRC